MQFACLCSLGFRASGRRPSRALARRPPPRPIRSPHMGPAATGREPRVRRGQAAARVQAEARLRRACTYASIGGR
jgi:hypothetical protein